MTALPPLPAVEAESRPARIVSYRAERVEVEVPPGVPGLLVLTDSYFPGWGATVNGRRATVLPADVAFREVMLGSGDGRGKSYDVVTTRVGYCYGSYLAGV